ncbi:MAG: hypothetical protein EZS28_029608 [Streblomastix strix]|uniref:Uncharacterized protein n=1 Tax=Streblomastix strix TaxID=222440 RepID=A0A5J4UVY6_9EUKA|nr:MAG: hypothetical protein EZS28_029608 [Streblomastix strix]
MVQQQQSVGQPPWTIVWVDELSGTAMEGPRLAKHKTEIEIATSRRQWIVSLIKTTLQSKTTPYLNKNQSTILNVDLMGIFTNPFSILKAIYHQYIAGEAAQVHYAPGETFSTNGNIRSVVSSTDSIVSGNVAVAGTKSINIQTVSSTQLHRNPICEPEVEKKEENSILVRSKDSITNTSVVANQNLGRNKQH